MVLSKVLPSLHCQSHERHNEKNWRVTQNKMKIQTTLQSTRIKITEPFIRDTYYIEQCDESKRFYITSDNGYNGYEGDGHKQLEQAISRVKNMIKNYFSDRGEENPTGF